MQRDSTSSKAVVAKGQLAKSVHLRAIEGNPLTTEEIDMFEMFEREGLSPERCRAHIHRRIENLGRVSAAE